MVPRVTLHDHLPPGTVVAGDYRVVEKIGEGGMGVVYLVEQLSVGARRALKLMRARLLENPGYRERFLREARIAVGIPSDHVVQVLGAGVASGFPWIAMEYLRGEDLAESAARSGPVGPTIVREILEQLCHGLSAAHDLGVVHRDMKPENIFLAVPRRTGAAFTVKILDFGIAKAMAGATETLQVGSPGWMAPEQASGAERIGPYTDTWSLGLIVFWLLTGKSYWLRANEPDTDAMSLLYEAAFGDLPPASTRAAQLGLAVTLPAGFDHWFARCVVRRVGERFPAAREAMDALRPVLAPASTTRLPATLPMGTGTAPMSLAARVNPDATPAYARTEPAHLDPEPVIELRRTRSFTTRRRQAVVVGSVALVVAGAAAGLYGTLNGGGYHERTRSGLRCGPGTMEDGGACVPHQVTIVPPAASHSAESAPGHDAGFGSVSMTCSPACEVNIDDAGHYEVSAVPKVVPVATGEHDVEARWKGLPPHTRTVLVRQGEQTLLKLKQHPHAQPAPTAKPAGGCGCPPGDLQCAMKCAAGGG